MSEYFYCSVWNQIIEFFSVSAQMVNIIYIICNWYMYIPYCVYCRRSWYCVKWLSTEDCGFQPNNNSKWYYCYSLSTELIRLSVSSADSQFCIYGNWSALSTAQVGKLVLPYVHAVYFVTSVWWGTLLFPDVFLCGQTNGRVLLSMYTTAQQDLERYEGY